MYFLFFPLILHCSLSIFVSFYLFLSLSFAFLLFFHVTSQSYLLRNTCIFLLFAFNSALFLILTLPFDCAVLNLAFRHTILLSLLYFSLDTAH